MIENFHLPANLKESKYDRLDYTLKFMPGNNGIGAIALEFINAIYFHDKIAEEIEALLTKIDKLKREFRRRDKKLKKLERRYNGMRFNPMLQPCV